MVTINFGILLAVSIGVLIWMARKNYENVDIRYWTLFILFPMILMGYWFKTRVTTVEGAMLSFCIIYLDSTVLLVLVLFIILHFLRIPVKPWMKLTAYSMAFGHLGMIWICFSNKLYYESIILTVTENGTITKMTSGPLKMVHWVFLSIVLAANIAVLIIAFIRKGTYSRRSLALCTGLMGAGLLIYCVETLVDVSYSALPYLYVLADLLLAANYDHVHMHDISGLIIAEKESRSQQGYAAFDMERRYLGCNVIMFRFLPGLKDQIVDANLKEGGFLAGIFYDLIDEFERNGITAKKYQMEGMTCECSVTKFLLHEDGKVHGYLFSVRDVTKEQRDMESLARKKEDMAAEVTKKTENIRSIQRQVVIGLANMIENRDNNTGGHVKRTSDIIGFVVDAVRRQGVYEIDETMAQDIIRAAPMHDLGKITIENSILLKNGKLDADEYNTMKTHAEKSGEFVDLILKDVEEEHFVRVAHNVARHHHERWDGRGYPDGLVGEMIPLEARIMAIADVYDALVSKRVYKPPMSYAKAAEIMKEGMGTQFDPNMYTVFLDCREQLEKYYSENVGDAE